MNSIRMDFQLNIRLLEIYMLSFRTMSFSNLASESRLSLQDWSIRVVSSFSVELPVASGIVSSRLFSRNWSGPFSVYFLQWFDTFLLKYKRRFPCALHTYRKDIRWYVAMHFRQKIENTKLGIFLAIYFVKCNSILLITGTCNVPRQP